MYKKSPNKFIGAAGMAAIGATRRVGTNDALAQLLASRQGGGGLLGRSEEHTSELQSLTNLVCRLLLEKNKSTQELKHTRFPYSTKSITM